MKTDAVAFYLDLLCSLGFVVCTIFRARARARARAGFAEGSRCAQCAQCFTPHTICLPLIPSPSYMLTYAYAV